MTTKKSGHQDQKGATEAINQRGDGRFQLVMSCTWQDKDFRYQEGGLGAICRK